MKQTRWVERAEISLDSVAALLRRLPLKPLTARVLLARQRADDRAEDFLQARLVSMPDPMTLAGMGAAVDRLSFAIRKGEKISIHGDYDVDGISATALMVDVLRHLGADVDYHIPLRMRDGYGLSAEALRRCAATGTRVVVSVDCGISAHDEAELARQLGLDLIVTDHHQVPEELPAGFALINPHLPDCRFPDKNLCGVGVAFMVLIALRRTLREQGWFAQRPEPDLKNWLDLVALGTIADLVPLTGINRPLVRYGLELMERTPRPGIRALREVAGVRTVSTGTVGFQLAPRLNAAGRLEDAGAGVQLLLARDDNQALPLARMLDDWNQQRRLIEGQTFEEAVAMVKELPESCSLVLASERWHQGVIGIVASRLVERYARPTLMIALDGESGKGSGRSVRGFHLYEGLKRCAQHLTGFGGHEFAAGFSLARDRIDSLREAFEQTARSVLSPDDLVPQRPYDAVAELGEFDEQQVRELESLAPFGMGNPEPVFLVENVTLGRVEQVGGGRHLRCLVRQDGTCLPAIGFNMAADSELARAPVDLLFTPGFNRWNGRETLQLRLRDMRPSGDRG
ncbi:MAG: single-stranded-DNA-specific exonuclease RecJ [Deltaproteobacteria bacterium]|nr:MAG: single-stranded-DNA-specific exonuclease RecJ [Deltaproteobacteria bacterium]